MCILTLSKRNCLYILPLKVMSFPFKNLCLPFTNFPCTLVLLYLYAACLILCIYGKCFEYVKVFGILRFSVE